MSFLFLAVGIVLLYIGGEFLVRNATALATRLGISPLVIGLTVVAFGTSAPELAATLASVFNGAPELATGNVVGSNTANVGLILASAALIFPLYASKLFLRRDFPVMLAVSLILIPILLDGVVSRLEGGILVAVLITYLVYLIKFDPKQIASDAPSQEIKTPVWKSLSLLGFGVLLLVLGARALVTGAIDIASSFGVPEEVIGLTFVAFGTSLPELASSIVAASKKQGDIILGNVIGSNIFNVLAILGITALVKPINQNFAAISTDIYIMLGFSIILLPLVLIFKRFGRVSGAVLLLAYISYIAYLFLK